MSYHSNPDVIQYSRFYLRGPNLCEFCKESQASKFLTDTSTITRAFLCTVMQFANLITASIIARL